MPAVTVRNLSTETHRALAIEFSPSIRQRRWSTRILWPLPVSQVTPCPWRMRR